MTESVLAKSFAKYSCKEILVLTLIFSLRTMAFSQGLHIVEAKLKWYELLQLENYPINGNINEYNSLIGFSTFKSDNNTNASYINFLVLENIKHRVCGNQIRKMDFENGHLYWKADIHKIKDTTYNFNYSFHSQRFNVESDKIDFFSSTSIDNSILNNHKYASKISLNNSNGRIIEFTNTNPATSHTMSGNTGYSNNFIYPYKNDSTHLVVGMDAEYIGGQPLPYLYFKSIDTNCNIAKEVLQKFHYQPTLGDSLHWSFMQTPSTIRVNDTLVGILHFQRSAVINGKTQKHRYQLALVNIKHIDHIFEVYRINLEDIMPEPYALYGSENNYFNGKEMVLSNFYFADTNKSIRERYIVKIDLKGKVVMNLPKLKYNEHAYFSRLIYFGEYEGKEWYGGYPSSTDRIGYDIFTIENNGIHLIGSITEDIKDDFFGIGNVDFCTITDKGTIVMCVKKNIDIGNGKYDVRNHLFALNIKDIIDFQTSTAEHHHDKAHYLLYPNPAQSYLIYNQNDNIKTEVKILNMDGKMYDQFICEGKDHKIIIDVSTFENGTYFIQSLKDHKVLDVKKIIIAH